MFNKSIYAPSDADGLQELKKHHQWVCWKKQTIDGRLTKVPYNPAGFKASTTKSAHWVSYQEALNGISKGVFDGIGFVFTADDPFIGIDLDHCIENGIINDKAQSIIESIGSYAEYSPSKTGIHIIAKGKIDKALKKKLPEFGFPIEIYSEKRYFTFTGDPISKSFCEIHDRCVEISELCNKLSEADVAIDSTPSESHSPSILSDSELIAKAESAKNGAKFRSLFYDGWSNMCVYHSQSEAVFALVSLLSFWTQDQNQIDRIFRRSALFSGKWEKKWNRQKHDILAKVKCPNGYGSGNARDTTTAKRDDYRFHIDFVQGIVHEMRRCILDDELYICLNQGRKWELAANLIPYIRGKARKIRIQNSAGKETCPYSLQAFEEYLDVYKRDELKPQLLFDIPAWDGIPRIRKITDHLKASDLTNDEVFELIVEWGAKAYLRVFDPEINQHFLLLTSEKQGIGKDVIVSALTGGFGHYSQPITLSNDETKVQRALSEIVIGRLSEFDKTNHVDMAMLKDIITTPCLFFDQKYLKGNQRRQSRFSLIGTANSADILRDWTGNRRFWIIKLTDIDLERDSTGIPIPKHNYPGDLYDPEKQYNQLQILAEFKHYAESRRYEASEKTRLHMAQIIGKLTPTSPDDEVLELWSVLVSKHLESAYLIGTDRMDADKVTWIKEHGWISTSDALPVFDQMSKLTGKKLQHIKSALKRKGMEKHSSYYQGTTARGFHFVAMKPADNPEVEELHSELKLEDGEEPDIASLRLLVESTMN